MKDLYIQTPREGLLAISTIMAEGPSHAMGSNIREGIERAVEDGLRGNTDFRTTDRLTEKLAKALKVLQEMREGTEMAVLSGDIDEVLVLSPDLEAMVERHGVRL